MKRYIVALGALVVLGCAGSESDAPGGERAVALSQAPSSPGSVPAAGFRISFGRRRLTARRRLERALPPGAVLEERRHESLTFCDPFHVARHRLHRLLEPEQPFPKLAELCLRLPAGSPKVATASVASRLAATR